MTRGHRRVEALEEIWSLGALLKDNDSWGQFLSIYRNMGADCVYTRTAASLLWSDPVFQKKIQSLQSLIIQSLEEEVQ